jgi:HK97 family phage major capsid protein
LPPLDPQVEKKLKDLQEEQSRLLVDVQAKNDAALAERMTRADFATFEAKVDKRWGEISAEILKLKAPELAPANGQDAAKLELHKRAFAKGLRQQALTAEEHRVLTISDDTTGGFLAAPDDYVRDIIRTITEKSPIRQLAWVRPTSARSIKVPKRTGQFSASRVQEIALRAETAGLTYGQEEMALPEAYALVRISRQDLEDSAFQLESEITSEIVEQFEVLEGTEFVAGNGVGKAEGFLTNAVVAAAFVETAGSNVIAADDMVGLQYALKEGYARNATWVMKRTTVKTVRILKEATTNAYIWQPGLQLGQPASLLGNPVVECVDMPSGLVDAQLEVAFGDFRRGYLIGDRIGIEIQRLNEKYAEYGQVGFLARKRFNGQVVLPEAIKVLKIKV